MKRTFSGQMIFTICLLFLLLILLSAITQVLYRRSLVNQVQEELTATVEAESGIVGSLPLDNNQTRLQLCRQLSFTRQATGRDSVVCDETGTVVACSCGPQQCEHLGCQFPRSFIDSAGSGGAGFSSQLSVSCYSGSRMAAVSQVRGKDDQVCYVVASVATSSINSRTMDSFRINLIVVLSVLLLAIPLVAWLVNRQTRPIKLMTAAARRMAHGQMDVRVSTGDVDTAELSDLAVAFNNMAQALAKSEQKRQEFVANVSHELKTPMTTISGYMDGMLDGTIPEDQQPKYMEIISGEVKRLSRLVRSMLEVSRIQDKGIPPEQKRVFDLCQTVGEVLLSFEQKINQKHLEVETDLPDQGARTLADQDSITQVVYNLIDNAVKFCPEGGTLSLRIRQTKGGKYLVSVRNTGPTIPPDELALVFDRFHKTDKSRSQNPDGVGLGLYIVKTIIMSHEEDIYVTSRDGVTEFSFTMPRVSGEALR